MKFYRDNICYNIHSCMLFYFVLLHFQTTIIFILLELNAVNKYYV